MTLCREAKLQGSESCLSNDADCPITMIEALDPDVETKRVIADYIGMSDANKEKYLREVSLPEDIFDVHQMETVVLNSLYWPALIEQCRMRPVKRGKSKVPAFVPQSAELSIVHLAARDGREDVLTVLGEQWPEILFSLDSNGNHVAHYAAESGRVSTLKWILGVQIPKANQFTSWYAPNNHGETFVEHAVKNNQLGILADQFPPRAVEGANHESHDERRRLAFEERERLAYYAAKSDVTKVLDWLLDSGQVDLLQKTVDLKFGDNMVCNIAHTAVLNKHVGVLDWIQNKGSLLKRDLRSPGQIARTEDQERDHQLGESLLALLDKPEDNTGFLLEHLAAVVNWREFYGWARRHDHDRSLEHTPDGLTFIHVAARCGHGAIFDWAREHLVLDGNPRLEDGSVAYLAAQYDQDEVLGRIYHEIKAWWPADAAGQCRLAHLAAEHGACQVLTWIAANRPDLVQTKNQDGYTIAHTAARFDRVEVLEWIEGGDEVVHALLSAVTDGDHQNVAHVAAHHGSKEVLGWVEANMSGLLGLATTEGYFVSHIAAMHGAVQTLEWINAGDATRRQLLDLEAGVDHYLVSHVAAKYLQVGSLQWINANRQSFLVEKLSDGRSIAHVVAEHGASHCGGVAYRCAEVLAWIVKNVNDPWQRRYVGSSVVTIAVRRGRLDVLKCLRDWDEHRKKGEKKRLDSWLVRDAATVSGQIEVLDWFSGFEEWAVEDYQEMAWRAVQHGQMAVLQWVGEKVVANEKMDLQSIQYGRRRRMNLAHWAIEHGELPALQWVANKLPGIIDEADTDGQVAAHLAVRLGEIACVEWLWGKNADSFKQGDRDGLTAIHYSAVYGVTTALPFLLDEQRWTASNPSLAHVAAACGQNDFLQAMWQYPKGRELIASVDENGVTLAHVAAGCGHASILKWMWRTKVLRGLFARETKDKWCHAIVRNHSGTADPHIGCAAFESFVIVGMKSLSMVNLSCIPNHVLS